MFAEGGSVSPNFSLTHPSWTQSYSVGGGGGDSCRFQAETAALGRRSRAAGSLNHRTLICPLYPHQATLVSLPDLYISCFISIFLLFFSFSLSSVIKSTVLKHHITCFFFFFSIPSLFFSLFFLLHRLLNSHFLSLPVTLSLAAWRSHPLPLLLPLGETFTLLCIHWVLWNMGWLPVFSAPLYLFCFLLCFPERSTLV